MLPRNFGEYGKRLALASAERAWVWFGSREKSKSCANT